MKNGTSEFAPMHNFKNPKFASASCSNSASSTRGGKDVLEAKEQGTKKMEKEEERIHNRNQEEDNESLGGHAFAE